MTWTKGIVTAFLLAAGLQRRRMYRHNEPTRRWNNTVNERDVLLTVITASEPVRFVDISTGKVVGKPSR